MCPERWMLKAPSAWPLHGWSFANETPFATRADIQLNYFSLSFWWVILTVPENKACPVSSANLSELRYTESLGSCHPWCVETVKWVLQMKMRKVTCPATGAKREWRQAWCRTKGVTGCTIFLSVLQNYSLSSLFTFSHVMTLLQCGEKGILEEVAWSLLRCSSSSPSAASSTQASRNKVVLAPG